MDLAVLFFYGIIFSIIILTFSKPELIIDKNVLWEINGCNYDVNLKTRYFPLILFIGFVFVCLASFQDVYSGVYDISNYKSFFDDAVESKSLKVYLETHDQEKLYLLLNWLISRFTNSFNFLLLIFFTFIFYSIFNFYRISNAEPNMILFFAVFSLVFTFVVQSFCILRTGLSVAAGLVVFSELQKCGSTRFLKKLSLLKIIFWTIISIGFHTLGLFILPVMFMFFLINKISIKKYLFLSLLLFVIGYIGSKIFINLFSFYKRFLIYLGQESKPAYKTYIANLGLLFVILYKRKTFFTDTRYLFHFNLLICSFFLLDLELMMSSIMFRMIYFTRPSTALLVSRVWNIYKPKKNDIIIPICVRFFLIMYILIFFYGFITAMPRYGLNFYKFGAIY